MNKKSLDRVLTLAAWSASFQAAVLWMIAVAFSHPCRAAVASMRPAELKCDSLVNPLGIDDTHPAFSWQLHDTAFAARQTAYQVEVASRPELLLSGKIDVWDSGRIVSGQSVGVLYAGPTLKSQQHYYWRVLVWNKDGRPYPVSAPAWWEMGLMNAGWHAQWIGYEDKEEYEVRKSGAAWVTNPPDSNYQATGDTRHDFRWSFSLKQAVKHADLFVTGEDTAAAWLNGKQVLAAQPIPPWGMAPWKRYTRQDLTGKVEAGENLLAVEITSFGTENGKHAQTASGGVSPMNACLYVELADGSVAVFTSGQGWKAALNSAGDWWSPRSDVSNWQNAILYTSVASRVEPSEFPLPHPWLTGPVKLLRREFQVSSPVVSARLYATALGAYQFHINGSRIGDQILSPGWTDFRTRVYYQVYDVTGNIRAGRNAIAAYLAPGWYTTPLIWFQQGYNYGATPPALKAQLRIEHADGSVQWIETDSSWTAADSPILKAEIYDGETLDSRRRQAGWDSPGFSATGWNPVEQVQPIEPAILAQDFQPIRVDRILSARKITQPKPGVFVYDFGQNLAGVPRLRVQGVAGTDVRLRFAEVLNADGTLYVENLRNAKATDHYILAGKGQEEFQPDFTFHGFRYVELTGLGSKLDLNTLHAVVIHTDAPFTARLTTGSPMLNQLWSNILWGQRSNFLGVPTDCPQRDERLGWAGDAEVFWRTASYNMDLTQFSKKYAGDLRATQVGTSMYGIYAPGTSKPNAGFGPGWSDAGVIIPWTDWMQSGDTRVIGQNWEAMEKYLSAIESVNPDYLWKNNDGFHFGDWLAPEGRTRQELIATAYWAYDASLMQEMAHALGKTEDEQKYAAIFSHIRAAFIQAFVHQDGFVAGGPDRSQSGQNSDGSAAESNGDTQTGYVLALNMNLVPDGLREAAGEKLVAKIRASGWHLGTGFLGTPYLLAALVDTGHSDVAYRLLLNTDYPSWGYTVEQGATTMWERWNGDKMRGDPTMNSYNHYSYGAVADWIYRYAAGVDTSPLDAGFHTVELHPNFDSRLGSLDFSYESQYGTIKSAWAVRGRKVSWTVTVPPNVTAHLALTSGQASSYTLDGSRLAGNAKLHLLNEDQRHSTYELPAGVYSFQCPLQ